MDVFIEDDKYVEACGVGDNPRYALGYIKLGRLLSVSVPEDFNQSPVSG